MRVLLLTLGCWCLGTDRLDAQQQAWEFSPYRIQVWLTTESVGELDDSVREMLARTLSQRIDAVIGAPWQAEVLAPPDELRAALLIDGDLVTPETLEAAAPESLQYDKLIFLTLRANTYECIVEARELDCRTRLFGPTVRRTVRQPAVLASACFDAVADSFRAVTRLEEGAPTSAIVRIRAGGLVLSQQSPCYVGFDDILLPIQRTNDRGGVAKAVVKMEWTFLQVQTPDETNPFLMTCRVWSGKPNPIQGRASARKERFALKVKATGEPTTLRVLSRVVRRDEVPYPMPGLEVYAKNPEPDPPPISEPPATSADESGEAPTEAAETTPAPAETTPAPAVVATRPAESADSSAPILLGRTDWNGTLEIGPGETTLRIVYLKNGAKLLARLPLVPGLEPMLIAQVPDDAPRLQAEGFIKGLQGQLMDLEAQREILRARFQLRMGEGKLDEAQKLLEEIKQLPTRNDLVRQLDQQQNSQVESPTKSVQASIDQLYAKMREALGKYLSPGLVNTLTNHLNDARRNARTAAIPATPAE